MDLGNFHSFIGLLLIVSVAWLCSTDRKKIPWRVIAWGLGAQLVLGAFIFFSPPGRQLFVWLNDIVVHILNYADAGTQFVLGPLATGKFYPGQKQPYFILATTALPKVIFFASLVGLLYYIGVMQWVVRIFSRFFTRLMGLSGAESLSVASNIFVGIESAFIVRPFYAKMTRSELLTVLAGCMATIASTVLGLYVLMLKNVYPSIAGHLMSASLLSAPAVLVVAKLAMPENDTPETLGKLVDGEDMRAENWIDAIIKNAMDGVKLAVGIAAMLIAFKGLVSLVDGVLLAVSANALTLKSIMGTIFYPFAWLMGVPSQDVGSVAQLLGMRLIETEVPAYIGLSSLMQKCAISPRAAVIASYSLCGFAHLPSIAIFVGGISALVPNRSKDLGNLAFRALFVATLACLMTGAVAGIFYTGEHAITLKEGQKTHCQAPQKGTQKTAQPTSSR